jgi:hypothetical protein
MSLVVAAVLLTAAPSFAGTPVYVGKRVAGTVSVDQIDHKVWDQILRKYVDKNGLVNYRALRASAADRGKLRAYLEMLSTVNPQTQASRNGQLAFWINAYNAVTVEGILQKYPTTSIRKHTSETGGYNIWKDLKLYVGGNAYSLDFMEHKVLRTMKEPRIHFAIVCASIGCPRLLNQAYLPKTLNQQLELNSKDFFARKQNFRYDAANRRFYTSAILDWFGKDFGANKAAQLKAISKWFPTDEAKRAAAAGVQTTTIEYSWKLNEQKAMAGSGKRSGSGTKAGSGTRNKVGAGRR